MHAPAFFVFMFRKECSEDDSGCAVMQQQGVEQGEEKLFFFEDLKKHYSLFALQVDSEAQAGGATRANCPPLLLLCQVDSIPQLMALAERR